MAGKKAKISSIEILEKFHNHLFTFSEDSLSVLDRVNGEILKRMRYLENDLAGQWRKEHNRWKEKLKEAQREASSSRTPSGRLAAEQLRRKSKLKIKEAEDKLLKIREWIKRAQNELPIPQARLLKMKTFIVNDVEKGRLLLKEYFDRLREYTEIKGDSKQ